MVSVYVRIWKQNRRSQEMPAFTKFRQWANSNLYWYGNCSVAYGNPIRTKIFVSQAGINCLSKCVLLKMFWLIVEKKDFPSKQLLVEIY